MADRPVPFLEYGRPPPSRWRGNVQLLFGLAIVLFGCSILGGYLGHIAAPAPKYIGQRFIALPSGTTPQSSPALAASIAEIQRPEVVVQTLSAEGLAGDSVTVLKTMSVSIQNVQSGLPKICIKIQGNDLDGAGRSVTLLAIRLEKFLNTRGQQNTWLSDPKGCVLKVEDPPEVWFIGGGVTLAILITGLILWRFNKYLLPPVAPAPENWQDHGQPG